MLVSEMRRQEATYFLMNWETRGSEQGLMEEWASGLCGWPGSAAEGQHRSVTSHSTSHQHPPCPHYSPLWGAEGSPATLPGLGMGSALQPTLDILLGSPGATENQHLEANATMWGLTWDAGGRNQG